MNKSVSPGKNAFCQSGHNICSTPSQCYCDCHKSISWTAKKIKREIDYHKTAIAILKTHLPHF